MEKSLSKRKNRKSKPWYLLIGFLLFFGGFIYFLIKPSTLNIAIDELQTVHTLEEIHASWDKHKVALAGEEEYLQEVRTKLASLELSRQQTEACLKWLPKPPQNLNIIIVPDLSGRINDEVNNPGQVRNDTILLNEVWRLFEQNSRKKMNSSDRLLVDVAGGNQAQGKFRAIANDLVFDLSDFNDKSNKLYFEGKQALFQSKIAELYRFAQQNPQGADYWTYFNHDLKRNIKQTTLFTGYRNILILLTDGYLEAQSNKATGTAFYTGTFAERNKVFQQLKAGRSVNHAVATIAPIMDCTDHFPELEVLVLEVNSRKHTSVQEPGDPGTPRDIDILRKMWTNWLTKLEVKNAGADPIHERLDATELSKQQIRHFIK